jgi:hypothetical protein
VSPSLKRLGHAPWRLFVEAWVAPLPQLQHGKLHMTCCVPRPSKHRPTRPSSLSCARMRAHAEGVPGRVLPEGDGVAIACKGCLAYTVRLPFLALSSPLVSLRSGRQRKHQAQATVYVW